eukprot:gene18209-24658_t
MRFRVMLVANTVQAFVGLRLMERIRGSSSLLVVLQMISCSLTVYFCQEYRARKRFVLDSAGQRWPEEERVSLDTSGSASPAVHCQPRAAAGPKPRSLIKAMWSGIMYLRSASPVVPCQSRVEGGLKPRPLIKARNRRLYDQP